MFTREDSPKQFSSDVPKLIVQRWFPRKTQICMIELLAAVVAVQTFREEIRGKLVLLFIDSEPVEAALIKSYSAKEDVCELVGLFWELVLELRCSVYIDRVPTDSNPADNPSKILAQVFSLPSVFCALLNGLWALTGLLFSIGAPRRTRSFAWHGYAW